MVTLERFKALFSDKSNTTYMRKSHIAVIKRPLTGKYVVSFGDTQQRYKKQ